MTSVICAVLDGGIWTMRMAYRLAAGHRGQDVDKVLREAVRLHCSCLLATVLVVELILLRFAADAAAATVAAAAMLLLLQLM